MRTNTHKLNLAGLLAGAVALASAGSLLAEGVQYASQAGGSKVKIEGTSSIHDWSMESSVITCTAFETDAAFPESAMKGGAAAKPKLEVSIPVRTLKSGNARMDEIYREHMEQPKFPSIQYKLTELKPKGDAPKNGKCEFEAAGTLTIHGTPKAVTMPVTIAKSEADRDGKKVPQLTITGKTSLKMSDYGVKPPSPTIAGMPTITTGDEVTITIEWSPVQK